MDIKQKGNENNKLKEINLWNTIWCVRMRDGSSWQSFKSFNHAWLNRMGAASYQVESHIFKLSLVSFHSISYANQMPERGFITTSKCLVNIPDIGEFKLLYCEPVVFVNSIEL